MEYSSLPTSVEVDNQALGGGGYLSHAQLSWLRDEGAYSGAAEVEARQALFTAARLNSALARIERLRSTIDIERGAYASAKAELAFLRTELDALITPLLRGDIVDTAELFKARARYKIDCIHREAFDGGLGDETLLNLSPSSLRSEPQASLDKSRVEAKEVLGVSKQFVLACFELLIPQKRFNLTRALGDQPDWLAACRVGPPGQRGRNKGTRWNLALVADALVQRGYVTRAAAKRSLKQNAPEWLDEFCRCQDDDF